jgi:hypothetical protein
VLLHELLGVFAFVRFAHGIDFFVSRGGREIFSLEGLALIRKLSHQFFEFWKIFFVKRSGQNKIVVKAIVDGGAKPQLRSWAHFLNGHSQKVGQGMADFVEIGVYVVVNVHGGKVREFPWLFNVVIGKSAANFLKRLRKKEE